MVGVHSTVMVLKHALIQEINIYTSELTLFILKIILLVCLSYFLYNVSLKSNQIKTLIYICLQLPLFNFSFSFTPFPFHLHLSRIMFLTPYTLSTAQSKPLEYY